MSSLLLTNATVIATGDGTEIPDASVLAEDGWITWVGPHTDLNTAPAAARQPDSVTDLSGHVVLPGLINTHHHLYQTLTRAVPAAQDAPLFDWLVALYPMWARMTPDDVRLATAVGLSELALSGCTTVFDHQYLWPNGSRLDDQVEAARDVGLRVHLSRGGMTLGESDGGLPPDSVVETHEQILDDYDRTVAAFHDPEPGSMTRVVIAPCSPFSVTESLMTESAEFARSHGLRLHTHLAETADEEDFCLQRSGRRPVAYAEALGWLGEDVWYAHAVHVNADEVALMGQTGTGVAHCPSSNMRLSSGIAPVRQYRDAGVPVALGVDGSASNDSSNMLWELRQALLLNRLAAAPDVGGGPMMAARTAIEMATVGGAEVLGRPDLGRIAPGFAADVIAISLDRLGFAGAMHDPVAAIAMCGADRVDHSWVGGRPVVEFGELTTVETEPLIRLHNAAARRIVDG